MEIVIMLLIGALIGRLASTIFTGSGLGIFGNVIIGILGSAIGYWLFGEIGVRFGSGFISSILSGVIGSIVIIIVVNVLFPGRQDRNFQ